MRYHEYEAIDALSCKEYEALTQPEDFRTAYEQLTPEGREEAQEEAIDRASTQDLIQALVDRGLPPYMERLTQTFFKRLED